MGQLIVNHSPVKLLSKPIYRRLCGLCFRGSISVMRDYLVEARHDEDDRRGEAFYLIDGGGAGWLPGWSLLYTEEAGRYHYSCYVRRKERRQGHGRQLFEAMRKWAKETKLCEHVFVEFHHDPNGAGIFFKEMNGDQPVAKNIVKL